MPKYMAEATNPADAQVQALSAMMGPMMVMMVVMASMMFFPFIRIALSVSAGSVIEPTLPFHSQYFVPTVFVVGSSIMVVNTIIRSFFVDSLKQAHNAHRGKQIGKQNFREARMERDTSRINKMQELQMSLGPENMATQAEMFRPMMFTIVFIIAIFSWMSHSIETFRVSYVSLPWSPTWSFTERIFWIIPAWIASYITMSAPLGRIIDRHIKIIRYKRHPLVLAAGNRSQSPFCICLRNQRRNHAPLLQEPDNPREEGPGHEKQGKEKRSRKRPEGEILSIAPPMKGSTCPTCGSEFIMRASNGKLRCDVCRYEWR